MFIDADTNKEDLVSKASFNKLVDMAASITSMYGYGAEGAPNHNHVTLIDQHLSLTRSPQGHCSLTGSHPDMKLKQKMFKKYNQKKKVLQKIVMMMRKRNQTPNLLLN